MKPKTIALLAAVVALLAGLAFLDRERPSTDERKKSEKKLFRLEADDVVALTLEWNGATIRLERDPKPAAAAGAEAPAFPSPREWRLVAPMTARADRTLADRLATTLAGLESERRLDGVERADVGLAPARGTIRWKSATAEGTLEIGGEVPASSSLVAAADGALAVIPRAVVADVDRAPGDWRAKEVLPAGRDEIERIRVVPSGGGVEVVLSRKGEAFAVERPYADAADADAVDPLLTDLTSLRVETFLDAPLAAAAEAGLAGGPGRFELALKGKTEPYVVELGATVPDSERRYVRAGGQAFEAQTRLADALSRAPEGWRSRRWTTFESWRVERLKVDDPAGSFELARRDGDWLRDGAKVPYTEVGDLLYALTSPRAERVVPGSAASDRPALTVVLADADGGEETLTLHPPTAEGVPARVSGRDVTLWLPAQAADDLRTRLAAVRAAKVEEADEAAPATGDGAAAGAAPEADGGTG